MTVTRRLELPRPQSLPATDKASNKATLLMAPLPVGAIFYSTHHIDKLLIEVSVHTHVTHTHTHTVHTIETTLGRESLLNTLLALRVFLSFTCCEEESG